MTKQKFIPYCKVDLPKDLDAFKNSFNVRYGKRILVGDMIKFEEVFFTDDGSNSPLFMEFDTCIVWGKVLKKTYDKKRRRQIFFIQVLCYETDVYLYNKLIMRTDKQLYVDTTLKKN